MPNVLFVVSAKFNLIQPPIDFIIGRIFIILIIEFLKNKSLSRNCGDGVCEKCSPGKQPVPERDWLTPVRVCTVCEKALKESKNERK